MILRDASRRSSTDRVRLCDDVNCAAARPSGVDADTASPRMVAAGLRPAQQRRPMAACPAPAALHSAAPTHSVIPDLMSGLLLEIVRQQAPCGLATIENIVHGLVRW
jgi:hypothetical protein